MSYRKEATTRVLWFSGAFVVSCLAAAIVGLLATVLAAKLEVNMETKANITIYSAVAAFAVTSGTLVYKIDQRFTKKFNKNP
jgi:hypothetical protein